MSRSLLLISTALLLAVSAATAASADDGERKLRLMGKGSAPAPASFVIDATISKGYEPLQSSVSGWFAALPPDTASGEVSGSCVEDRCALSVDLEDGKLTLTGDFAKAGATSLQGRAILADSYDDKAKGEAAVSYTAVGDDIPGLGKLAPDGAVGEHELASLVVWAGGTYGFNYTDDGPPGDMERDALGQWQAQGGRPGRGLILVDQLAALRAEAAAARAKARWTPVSGRGWSAGYPAALLSPAGAGRYASADGRSSLVYAVDPPLDDDAWDAVVDKGHEEKEGRDVQGYTRVNDDFEVTVEEAGVRTFTIFHRRKGGVARAALSYPKDTAGGLDAYETILAREFMVTDDVAP
jgi:hypothetical protein